MREDKWTASAVELDVRATHYVSAFKKTKALFSLIVAAIRIVYFQSERSIGLVDIGGSLFTLCRLSLSLGVAQPQLIIMQMGRPADGFTCELIDVRANQLRARRVRFPSFETGRMRETKSEEDEEEEEVCELAAVADRKWE